MTKKEQIVAAAIELFATNGYESTSIQQLAAAAGVAQGLLYRHFKSKDALLTHLLETGLAQIGHTLSPYTDAGLDFKAAFKQHVTLWVQQLSQHRLLWKVLHAVRQNTGLMAGLGLKGSIRALAAPIALKLQQAGYKNPEQQALMIVAIIDGATALYLIDPDSVSLEETANFLHQKIEGDEARSNTR